ncbi:MAG: S9 family peptidase [Bdellovibrionota bacterium]
MKYLFVLGALMTACAHIPQPPKAAERPHELSANGDVRVDPYFWMKERENPEVIKYLNDENAYLEEVLKPVKPLREKIYAEIRGRIKEDDSTVPFQIDGYFYYSRFETGKEYPIYCRKKGSLKANEEILINVNELAKGHTYFSVPFPHPSPDQTKLTYSADDQGRRFYTIYVKDLKTGKLIGEGIPNTTGDYEWAEDNKTIFYAKQHPDTLRSQWVYRHELGEKKDELIYEEKDETYNVGVGKARTGNYLYIVSGSTLSTEWRFLDSHKPKDKFQVFLPRERDHEYALEDGGDAFYIVTNWKAKNFRLMKAPHAPTPKEKWEEVIAHRADVLLEDVSFFKTHYARTERRDGLRRLNVVDRKTNAEHEISFPDPAYLVNPGRNMMYAAPFIRYNYESLNQPDSVFDYDFAHKTSALKKQRETPTLDPSLYVSERVWATARDGTKVPVSIVYKKGLKKDGTAPLFQYGYGSYGIPMEPDFSVEYFSLLDRGFVYAIAHIRGGSEMGRLWYENGKLLKKMNTFTDFIDVTDYLVKEKYCDPKRIYAEGGSAGGLLMGAVTNLRPELYRGIHAAVPFVDVLTTMLDESIPLTTGEYDEWGDPRKPEYYKYMKSYSPYDNVTAKAYPNVLVSSGLHDSQVQYWEPTKWAAKLRKLNTNNALILLHTEMDAGHSGASGRFEAIKDTALSYAFFLFLDGNRK